MQDGLGVVGIFDVLRDAEDVAALADVVLDVVVRALVRELGHFDFLRRELLVQVEEVQRGRWQVLDARQKNSCLQLWHWCFKLRRNERKRLVLRSQRLVQVDGLRHQVRVKRVQIVYK